MNAELETAIGVATIAVGIAAAIITYLADRKMSNPLLLGYMRRIMFGTIALSLFSLWHTVRETFELKEAYGAIIELPEYLLVILSYLLFLAGAIAVFRMSKAYGFREKGREIAKELEE
jgi:Na+-translocating ferredoxin:NAD+ oxidoreductase RnfA subunit